MVDLLLLYVVHAPELHAHMVNTYPEGSYERKAFEKLSALVPDMNDLAHALLEADRFGVELTAVENQCLREVVSAIRDNRAIMQEAGIDVKFTNLPPGFAGAE